MARSQGAMPNGGWPPQQAPNAEPDPRMARPGGQQQRPAQGGYPPQQQARPAPQQAAPGNMYPAAGYPEQPGMPSGYEPQQAYHYPQQAQPAPVTAPPRPRQGLSSFEGAPQPAQPGYGSYAQPQAQPGYGAGQQPAPQQRGYAPAAQPRQPNPALRPANGAPDYGLRQPPAEPRTAPPRYDQWPPAAAPQQAPNGLQGYPGQQDMGGGYDLGSYMPAGHQADGLPQGDLNGVDPLQQQAAWIHPAHADYGDVPMDQGFQSGDLGYEQGNAGALEPTYNQDESAEYEYEEPRRGSWVLRIAGAVVVAIGLGYGLAQGYKLVMGSSSDGETPVVRSDGAPARMKPADPGGKEFAHKDSKIMGRLGDGSADTAAASSSNDSGGTRKVTTLQVGPDGSIVPPAAPVETVSSTSAVSVPGVTVIDGFGGSYGGSVTTTSAAPEPPPAPKTQAASSKPIVVNPPSPPPPSAKPQVIAKATPSESAPKPKKTTTAAAPAASSSASGANGYVVVLASVPASSNSRLDALKKFADMQMQYGSVLQNKTPDVREANLGDRGTYHRLLVGPPGSRAQASQLCTQLKSAGYKDCWVTAY